MKQRYESGERTPELVNAYAMDFMEKKKYDEGYKIINDYFNSLTDKQKLSAEICLFSHDTLLTSPTRNVNIG